MKVSPRVKADAPGAHLLALPWPRQPEVLHGGSRVDFNRVRKTRGGKQMLSQDATRPSGRAHVGPSIAVTDAMHLQPIDITTQHSFVTIKSGSGTELHFTDQR